MKLIKILFIGCVESSYFDLEILIKHNKKIVGVVTKENSNFNSDFCDVSPLCKENNIPFFYAQNINSNETVNFIRECKPDIIYCFGWSQLLSDEILKIPPLGVIGNHPAELPKNRGRHPIIWALVLGLSETASSFFIMNNGADTGAIISQKKIQISDSDYARDLYNKITQIELEQIIEITEQFESDTICKVSQNLSDGNSWRKRSEVDGIIDWRMSAKAIYNLIRALSEPYVGACFVYKSNKIKVWKSEIIQTDEYQNIEPGKVIQKNNNKDYVIKAYDYLIHILDGDEFDGEEGEYL